MMIFISIAMLHIICGAICLFLIFKANPIKLEFNIFEILLFVIVGPLMVIVWAVCNLCLFIYSKFKRYEGKTKI